MTTALNWKQGNLAEGLRLYRARNYFEAHEQWEAVWLRSQEADKAFLQAMIQLAAACHHYERGNRRGVKSLLTTIIGRLNSGTFEDSDRFGLREEVQIWLTAIESADVTIDEPSAKLRLLKGLDS